MILRDYQRRVIDALWDWFRAHQEGNPIVEACVGAGKSVMIAALAREALTQWPGTRILMVVASRELCAQNLEKLKAVWPEAPAGVHSAGLGRKDLNRDVLYATIGSVAKKAHLLGRVDLLMVDEAHNISPKNAGMYRHLINELTRYNPALRVIGWTGTAFRGDGVWLTAADRGFLSPLVLGAATQRLEADGVRMSGGDFVVSALAEKLDRDELVQACADELVTLAADRRRWLVYGVTVEHARHIAEALQTRGIACAVVSAETPTGERDAHIRDFRAGRLRALVNVAVLTTGFDVPDVDCIALLRNTRSPVLYVQIAGRGLRIADGKRDCIAEGQRVLTDRGLVPIENVTRDMLVWDGVSFVRHDGAVCKGERDVITYAGLTATPDHRVWTKRGWVTFAECAAAGLDIAVGGHGGSPVRETDRHFRGRDDHQGEQVFAGALHKLRRLRAAARRELAQADGWLSSLWQPTVGTALAAQAVRVGVSTMHQPEQHELRTVRRAGHSLRVRLANFHGGVGAGELGSEQVTGNRSDRQRAGVQAGQSAIIDAAAKHIAHAQDGDCAHGARIQAGAPARPLRRCDSGKTDCVRLDAARDRGAMGSPVAQAKRRVWDLLNAGPLHRFTCEGLIVSNCLWLDFTDTTATLGPVDAIKGRRKIARASSGGNASPIKHCDHCGNPAQIMASHCESCGTPFPEPERINHNATASAISPLSAPAASVIEDVPVTDVRYRKWSKPGQPDSLLVEYWNGIMRVAREWVCIEHAGYARQKAITWWDQRSNGTPVPNDVASARQAARGLRQPAGLRLNTGGKYPEIVQYHFEEVEVPA
jgi:hypothetical protein